MKVIFLICVVMLSMTSSYCQRFQLAELIKMNSQNWDSFDTYVSTKGYTYQRIDTSNGDESRIYSFNQNERNDMAPYFITKTINTRLKEKSIAFITIKKDDYLLIKSQLKMVGFIYINSDATDTETSLNYIKGKMRLLIESSRRKNNSGNLITGYNITLMTDL